MKKISMYFLFVCLLDVLRIKQNNPQRTEKI
jgi:hypothetical protein